MVFVVMIASVVCEQDELWCYLTLEGSFVNLGPR